MTPVPRKIYLQLNNVPPCNFGALWSEERVNDEDIAYVLETDHIMQEKLDPLQELADLQHKVLCKRGAVVDELRKEIKTLKEEIYEMSTDTDFLSNLYRRLERLEKTQDTKYLESLKPVTPEYMTRTRIDELSEWRKDAERLAKTQHFYDYSSNQIVCPHCLHFANHHDRITHSETCPISLHQELVEKYRAK